ncbi:ABC transporter permease [Bradyrhizobium sp. AZCC 2230]|uniref:ABC transporter permease n=1 Tax=Bradyrhizobium sp. AZCC 2230 TaxID=3117021 RepID=UPI002FF0DAB2
MFPLPEREEVRELLLKRAASGVVVLLLVSVIAFLLVAMVPGDAASAIAGTGASEAELQRVRASLGLDQSILVQATRWYSNVLVGDFGQSVLLNRPVASAILERLPVTLSLTCYALLLALLLGIGAGVAAALRPGSRLDHGVMTTALLGLSLPDFWLGLVGIYVFAVSLGWFSTGGYVPLTEHPLGWLRTTTLPAISLAITQLGLIARMTRANMIEVLSQDYIRTARAKGLPAGVIVFKHALRNIAVPLLTVLGIVIGVLFSGAVVIESIFSVPGVGRLIIGAVQSRDLPVIQGGVLFVGAFMVLVNLVIDMLCTVLDPQMR